MRKCKVCAEEFKPTFTTTQSTCSVKCAIEHVKVVKDKKFKARTRELKTKQRNESKSWHVQTLQKIFNRFIRLRDIDKPCVSCGRDNPPYYPRKGQWDAGHFRSVGGNWELRFNEQNCHKECVYCNINDSEHLLKYRKNLIIRVGEDVVEFLEGPHKPQHYTIPELQDMIKLYRGKIKAFELRGI